MKRWLYGLIVAVGLGFISVNGVAQTASFRDRVHESLKTELTEEDVKAEIEFGRGVAAAILARYPLWKNEAVTGYVSKIGTALSDYTNRSELTFYFAILDTDEINAYAAPGGYIFITRGALQMMRDESELAAVLAHELVHVSQRHIVNSLDIKASDKSGQRALTGFLGGAVGDTLRVAFSQAVGKAMDILFTQGLNHEQEYESDELATVILMNAGYDASSLRRYLQRVDKKGNKKQTDVATYTHPSFGSRVESLEGHQAELSEGARAAQRFKKETRSL